MAGGGKSFLIVKSQGLEKTYVGVHNLFPQRQTELLNLAADRNS